MVKKIAFGLVIVFGLSSGLVSPAADFNGDGTNDIGVYRGGLWAVRNVTRLYFGGAADDPVPGDYNGDGVMDFGLFLAASGRWAVRDVTRVYYGSGGEPLPGIMLGGGGGSLWGTLGGNVYRTSGKVGIGTSVPGSALDVEDDVLGYVAEFVNTHGTSNSSGILVQAGSYGAGGSGSLIDFQNGLGALIGDIEVSGNDVVYNNFTGGHPASISGEAADVGYPYGTVMRLKKTVSPHEQSHQVGYVVEPSTRPYDKSVFGIYSNRKASGKNLHNILTVGDGRILVTKEGGDIEVGDYLTTSSKEGHAMKQYDDLLHGYTVAKAQEPVRWGEEKSESKLIACTYHAQ